MTRQKENFYETREKVKKLFDKFGTDVFTSREAGEALGIDMTNSSSDAYKKFMADFQRLKTMMVVVSVDTRISPDTRRVTDYYLIVDKDLGSYNRRFSPEEKKRRQIKAQEIKDNYIKNIKMNHRFVAPTQQEMDEFHEKFVEKAFEEQPVTEIHEETPIQEQQVDDSKFTVCLTIQEILGERKIEFEQHNLTLNEVKERLNQLKEMI